VIGVFMREQDRVEPVDLGAQGLRPEVRRRIDQDIAPTIADENRRPQAIVRGSLELQTSQWHPIVGTPMLVPEPSTVMRSASLEKRHLRSLAFFHGLDISESEFGE